MNSHLIILIVLLTLPVSTLSQATPGSLDVSFHADGKVTTNLSTGFTQNTAYNAVKLSNSKIVVVGSSFGFLNYDLIVARYNGNGEIDTSFGTQGYSRVNHGAAEYGHTIALQADGKILAGGTWFNEPGQSDFLLVRLNNNGSLDETFGGQGTQTIDFFGGEDRIYAAGLQSDGKIIAAGYANQTGEFGSLDYFALARFHINGTLDSTFGISGSGKVATYVSVSMGIKDLAIQPHDDKIVVTGVQNGVFTVMRYNANGTVDAGFGANGMVETHVGDYDYSLSIELQADHKILIGGTYSEGPIFNGSDGIGLVRYHENGDLDTSFGENGVVKMVGTTNYMNGFDMKQQADGKIVVSHQRYNGAYDFLVARFNSDGTPDSAFGELGKVTTDFGGGDIANSLAIQINGDILVAGSTQQPGGSVLGALARYIGGLASGIHSWNSIHFTPAELADLNISGPLADAENDGIPNAVEYALGLGPKTANPTPWQAGSQAVGPDQHPTITFSVPETFPADATLIVEEALSLEPTATWTTLATKTGSAAWAANNGGVITQGVPSGGRIPITVRSPTAMGGVNPSGFLRLRVQVP